uniref:Uncharacterized protein n=1 Tax=viral metagenome TaxID=1070528 RepID=A0A6C0F7C5_9ZZZZ|tara:strand:- start:6221 stop:6445 length:225 start_codon:yes stop_codon:yes gene_type:complete
MDKFCKQAAGRIIDELKKKENRNILEDEILDPVIKYIGQHLYPYIIAASVMFCITLIILAYLLFSIKYIKYSVN